MDFSPNVISGNFFPEASAFFLIITRDKYLLTPLLFSEFLGGVVRDMKIFATLKIFPPAAGLKNDMIFR